MLEKKLNKILKKVQKPGRYTGGELNSVVKDPKDVKIRYAFCFPDSYEIGMSNLGMKIICNVLNQRDDTYCERVFAPWPDMEEEMKKEGVVNAYGRYYVLDASGVVLECTGSQFPDTVAGPTISGLLMDNNNRVVVVIGEKLPVRDSGQLESMERVLTELDNIGMLGRISQLDVKNLDNLYLMTTDGVRIVLGDASSLRTKLLIAREVLSVREPLGMVRGSKIDVSSGREAHYIPDTLPTVTPVPTATPTPAPAETPEN